MKKGKILDGRSNKSKEKFADHLMKLSNALFTSFVLSISVIPLTMLVQFAFKNNDKELPPFLEIFHTIGWVTYPALLFVIVTFVLSYYAAERAMDIYDKLDVEHTEKT